jgi:hypothetical protein
VRRARRRFERRRPLGKDDRDPEPDELGCVERKLFRAVRYPLFNDEVATLDVSILPQRLANSTGEVSTCHEKPDTVILLGLLRPGPERPEENGQEHGDCQHDEDGVHASPGEHGGDDLNPAPCPHHARPLRARDAGQSPAIH